MVRFACVFASFALIATACGSDKDTDTDADTSSSGEGTEGSETDSTAADTSGEAGEAEATTGSDDAETSGETGDDDAEATGEADTSEEDSSTSEADTGNATEQELCEQTEGTWDDGACGHYQCGVPNSCEALIPGCNCGAGSNFVEGEGCVEDPECTGGQTFACGDSLQCSLGAEYCSILHPGPGGPSQHSCQTFPEPCDTMPTCACLESIDVVGPESICADGRDGSVTVELFAP